MFTFFNEFLVPLFFETTEKNRIVNKLTLYVTKEIHSYVETEEGGFKAEISKVVSPKVMIYEGKTTVDPNKIRTILSDPLKFPQKDPEALEKAITFEHKDMISTVHEMINTTMESFSNSAQMLLDSLGMFFSGFTLATAFTPKTFFKHSAESDTQNNPEEQNSKEETEEKNEE